MKREKITDDYRHRLNCYRCGNVILASKKPLPQKVRDLLIEVPCSKCVDPKDYLKDLLKE